MKNIYYVIILFLILSCNKNVVEQEEDNSDNMNSTEQAYKNQDGSEYVLSNSYITIEVANDSEINEVKNDIENGNFILTKDSPIYRNNLFLFESNKQTPITFSDIEKINQSEGVKKVNRVYKNEEKLFSTNKLIVKIKADLSVDEVLNYIKEQGGSISDRSAPKHKIYFITIENNQEIDILQLANNLVKSNYFEYIEPDMIYFAH